MLDIKFIRENRDIVKNAAIKKHISVDVDKLIAVDNDRLDLLKQIEEQRAKQNTQSSIIQRLTDNTERQQAIDAMRDLKEGLKEKEVEYKKIHDKWHGLDCPSFSYFRPLGPASRCGSGLFVRGILYLIV